MDRRPHASLLTALSAALLAGACVVGGTPDEASGEREGLTPTFAPETTVTSAVGGSSVGPTTTTTTNAGRADGGQGSPVPGSQPGVTTAVPPAQSPAGATSSRIDDPSGDLTVSLADRPPGWADLVGGTLTRTTDGFHLSVRLAQPPPAVAPDEDHTMNVAAFFDVDGDGSVDTEVWANLASGGWGGAWFDDDSGDARFVDESGVDVGVEGGELILRFPTEHVRGAETFRWSLASEWGRHAVIGTSAAARDDAPDGDRPVRFPG